MFQTRENISKLVSGGKLLDVGENADKGAAEVTIPGRHHLSKIQSGNEVTRFCSSFVLK